MHAPPPRSDPSPPDVVSRLVRSVVPLLGLGAVFVGAVLLARHPLRIDDTFFHLRFGQEFLDGWSASDPGSISAAASRDWVPTQWLSQLAMAAAEDAGGLAFVSWIAGACFLTYVLVLYLVSRVHAPPLVAAVVTAVCFLASTQGLSARPQVISYILIVITTEAWLRTGVDGRARWWLVPMTWVWAMLHGMWLIGVVIGLAGVLGAAFDGSVRGRSLAKLAVIPIASTVVAALTPVGPKLLTSSLVVAGRGRAYYDEFQPTDFTGEWRAMLVAALCALVVVVWVRGRTTWTSLLLFLLAGAWAIYMVRTVPVAAAMLAPLAAMTLATLTPDEGLADHRDRWLAAGGCLVGLVVLAFAVANADKAGPEHPEWVAQELDDMPPETRMVNEWRWGGYLMWRYPQHDFAMSGYTDIYTEAEHERNLDLTALRDGWLESLDEIDPGYALLDAESDLAYTLMELTEWTVVREDDDVVLLKAP